MKAAVFHGRHDVRIEEIEKPTAGAGEVVVRVETAGICGSDAAEYEHGPILIERRDAGFDHGVVIGHEFGGTVVSVGEGVDSLEPGSVVVCGAGISCGTCTQCLAGRTNLCRTYHTVGLHRDGGLAEYVSVPASILYDASASGLGFDTLAMAQPMAIAVHALRRSGLKSGQDAAIIGAGGIGAFLVFAAAALGARVFVSDLDDERLSLAKDLGAYVTERAGSDSLGNLLDAHDMEPTVFFEVSGSRQGLDSILTAAKPGATIVPVGLQKLPLDRPLIEWSVKEFTVVGSAALVFATDIPEAVRLLASRDGDWSDVAAEVLPLEWLVDEGLIPIVSGSARSVKTLISPALTVKRAADHSRIQLRPEKFRI
ncbi:MAG: hypothetical protein JWQ64_1105 [Subtercola sp.]|nr:hypothetical protein [Subtercola sp.]